MVNERVKVMQALKVLMEACEDDKAIEKANAIIKPVLKEWGYVSPSEMPFFKLQM